MMDEDDCSWYQCKQCPSKFKTTAEIQKHNRLNHRKPIIAKKSLPNIEKDDSAQLNNGSNNLENSGKTGDRLSCGSCKHQFDTGDPVVLHLLNQNKCENGAFKCPYCVKVQLQKYDAVNEKVDRQRASPFKNLSMRRRNKSSGKTGRVHFSNQSRVEKRKRKPLSESMDPTSVSNLSSVPNTPSPSTLQTPYSPSAAKRSVVASSERSSGDLNYELLYKRKTRGKGSRGGKGADNVTDPPMKVSVRINNNPFPSSSRLAVPKSKHYEKGNIACQYCGFVAKSIREIQFHVNTHMAKSYPCEFCSAIYRSKQGVTKHTVKQHADQKPTEVSSNPEINGLEEDEETSNYSSSMTSDVVGENYDQFSNSNSMINDDSCSQTTVSYLQPECESSYSNNEYGFGQSYFSNVGQPHTLYQAGCPTREEEEGLEKVVDLANF